MPPVSLNPPTPSFPLTDQIPHRNRSFVSPNNLDSTSLSCFNILDQRQTREIGELRLDQEDDELVLHGGSSNHKVYNSSLISFSPQAPMDDRRNVWGIIYPCIKWRRKKAEALQSGCLLIKMKLMRRMMTPNNPITDKVSNSSSSRVCADCNTTSTPLWRSGPKGPKSLCNACGIRQRKAARRAMAEAANGRLVSSTKKNKENKCRRTNHLVEFKNKWKEQVQARLRELERRKIGLKDFALSLRRNSGVEQRDEVAEAALLLMDLSCAFLHL